MKRFFYHLICVLLSFIQTLISLFMLFVFLTILMQTASQGEIAIIVLLIIQFILAIIDYNLRDILIDPVSSCIGIVLVSPVKFFLHLITFFQVCASRDPNFGLRGDYHHDKYINKLYYFAWNKKGRIETESGRIKREENERKWAENIEKQRIENAKKEQQRLDIINNYRRADRLYNLHFVPLANLDSDSYGLFSTYTQGRTDKDIYVDGFWINGVQFVQDRILDQVSFSLKPGYYTFKIKVKLKYRVVGGTLPGEVGYNDPSLDHKYSIDKTYEIKDVYIDGTYEYFLAFSAFVHAKWERYTFKGSNIHSHDAFMGWDKNIQFDFFSKSTLDKACSYWDLHDRKI